MADTAIGQCLCGTFIRAGDVYQKTFTREPVYGRIGDPSGGLSGLTRPRVEWKCSACIEAEKTP